MGADQEAVVGIGAGVGVGRSPGQLSTLQKELHEYKFLSLFSYSHFS